MSTYLDIAAAVLRAKRRPMSSRGILAEAHRAGLVPSSLFGKTQHKTLGARISEDIIARRGRSRFFRTAPGRYFLREFLGDVSVPDEFRRPFPARRRIRELARGPALAIGEGLLDELGHNAQTLTTARILELLKMRQSVYLDPKRNPNAVFVRSFVCVCRGSRILSYKLGRYRDDRDTFLHKRSIGFSTLVHIDDETLFNAIDLGIVEAGVRAVKLDLDIPPTPTGAPRVSDEAVLLKFILASHNAEGGNLLALVSYQCPHWFEPATRRLALNDLRWIELAGINDARDYDPWSRAVLEANLASRVLPSAPL